jgi:flagellar FliL protein
MMFLSGGGETAAHVEEGEKKKNDHAEKRKDAEHKSEGEGNGDGVALKISSGEGVTNVGLPQLLINMATDDGRPAILKLKLTIEAKNDEAVQALEARLPRVMDQFQGFLRELRIDDLAGSAGTARLRIELLRRVNLAIAPAQAHAVLIEEMLVQ